MRAKRSRRNSDRCKIRIQTQAITLFDHCLLLFLSCFVRYGNVQYGYGKVCFDDGRRNNSCSILVSRRQRAVYVDIGFCVGQIRAQNNYNCDVLFSVGVLFAVYFKRYVQVDSVFDRLCNSADLGSTGAGDTIGGIMFSESSPTNLRSSVTVINTLLNGVMGGLATVISMILLPVIPEKMFGYMYLGLTVPGLVGAIVIMWLFVGETRGLDLKKVTGTEWDKPKEIKEETQEGE